MLNISKSVEGKKAEFVLSGKLNTITASDLEKEVEEVIGGLESIVFDFKELVYISSAGLRVLLAAQQTMNEKEGTLLIKNCSAEIMDIFVATGFTEIMSIE